MIGSPGQGSPRRGEQEVMGPGMGRGYKDVVGARDTELLSLGAAAMLSGLVRRRCSCQTYQLP